MRSIRTTCSITFFSGIVFILTPQHVHADTIKEIKVAKHIVKGSGVTAEQMEKWMKQANEAFKTSFKFVQDNAPDQVDKVGDGKVDGAINVYGSDLKATAPGNPGEAWDQNYINVGQSAPDSTMAHEIGHWLGAVPDSTSSEHGTPMGEYPGHPGYMGSDTNGDGKADAEDQKNLMYPGVGRKGIVIDDKQQQTAHKKADEWLKSVESKKTGRGKDEPDPIGDSLYSFTDIVYDSVWGYGQNKDNYEMHFSLQTSGLDFSQDAVLGFMIESDQNLLTGVPGTGVDYFLGYEPVTNKILFERYDTLWQVLDTTSIQSEFALHSFDGPFTPIPIGINLNLPLSLFDRRGSEDLLSFLAMTKVGDTIMDASPDAGMKTISTQPVPEPETLFLMTLGSAALGLTQRSRKTKDHQGHSQTANSVSKLRV